MCLPLQMAAKYDIIDHRTAPPPLFSTLRRTGMNNDPNFESHNAQQSTDTPTPKRCPVCGKEADPRAAFCGQCGHSFSGSTVPGPAHSSAWEDRTPLRTSDYLVMFFVSSLPFVGLILMLIWAFSAGVNVHRRNFCRAYLLFAVIVWILAMVLSFAMVMSGMAIPYY